MDITSKNNTTFYKNKHIGVYGSMKETSIGTIFAIFNVN